MPDIASHSTSTIDMPEECAGSAKLTFSNFGTICSTMPLNSKINQQTSFSLSLLELCYTTVKNAQIEK